MKLRKTTLALIIALLPSVGLAQTAQDSIVRQLTQQGFRDITVSRTFLGRVRIMAMSDDLRREIVFNPATGEIIRDYWEDLDDDSNNDSRNSRIVNPRSNSGQGNASDDDLDDRDVSDDRDDRDADSRDDSDDDDDDDDDDRTDRDRDREDRDD